ncbi:hexokinase [Pontiella sp.]|uniref:hexokinase n=1 Tax=Pontiella sp. TaxID=2837462 RepID=UPI0035649890
MMSTNVDTWLKDKMISADVYSAEELLNSFLSEMENGLNGEGSSLAMIPAFVGADGTVPAGKSVAVIDAGGTNLRVCTVKFNEQGDAELAGFSKQPMPGRFEEKTKAEFYQVLVDALEPMKDEFESIGFCFSYPAAIKPNFDGKLLHWTKEIKIPELVGEHVGAGLLEALEARGITGKHVVVLNDTVACLLAGLAKGQSFHASSYIGFILGTGTNTAYVEKNSNIGKLINFTKEGSQVVNVESGGFAAFKRGPLDLKVDNESVNPGGHVFEKLLSGVYMGTITLELLKALSAELGVFSESGAKAIAAMDDLYIIQIDNLAAENGRDIGELGSDQFSDADREVMRTVFKAVVDRASLLTAVNICAAVVKGGAGTEADKPVCVNIDGSTYYYTYQMAEKVQAVLQPMLAERGLHIECIQVDDAPVVGAAIAGLTTFA